jgi:hypothetical protein
MDQLSYFPLQVMCGHLGLMTCTPMGMFADFIWLGLKNARGMSEREFSSRSSTITMHLVVMIDKCVARSVVALVELWVAFQWLELKERYEMRMSKVNTGPGFAIVMVEERTIHPAQLFPNLNRMRLSKVESYHSALHCQDDINLLGLGGFIGGGEAAFEVTDAWWHSKGRSGFQGNGVNIVRLEAKNFTASQSTHPSKKYSHLHSGFVILVQKHLGFVKMVRVRLNSQNGEPGLVLSSYPNDEPYLMVFESTLTSWLDYILG